MTRTVDIGAFEFECGESVPRMEVAFETYGEFDGENAVLVCHALTGGPTVARTDAAVDSSDQARAWWNDVVGPGKYVDTDEYFVVCANVPGSCYGTTGPASENPDTGQPYGPGFPPVTVGDWTRAQRRLLDELGLEHLSAVVGGSVGGMNVLEWVRRYPGDLDCAIPVATAARLDPQMLALDAVARRAITGDPHYDGGEYYGDDHPDPTHGLAQARRIGHVTYLSKASIDRRFGRRPADRERPSDPTDGGGPGRPDPDLDPSVRDTPVAAPTSREFPYREVESYLDYNASTFVERFDANSYLYLTAAMADYDLAREYPSDAAALQDFDGATLLVSFSGDWHFPPDRADSLATAFRDAGVETTHYVVDSDYGHDAFLVEPHRVGPPIAAFLDERRSSNTPTRSGAPVHASLFS